jgi:hypothetical protein
MGEMEGQKETRRKRHWTDSTRKGEDIALAAVTCSPLRILSSKAAATPGRAPPCVADAPRIDSSAASRDTGTGVPPSAA